GLAHEVGTQVDAQGTPTRAHDRALEPQALELPLAPPRVIVAAIRPRHERGVDEEIPDQRLRLLREPKRPGLDIERDDRAGLNGRKDDGADDVKDHGSPSIADA